MEYCPGGDLSKLLDENGPLPEPLAKIYVSEIILALEALH
jgi:serine/threonine protein kinase